MRAEHGVQAVSAAVGDPRSSGSAAYVRRSLRSVEFLSERLGHLIARAMEFLETDRQAAWMCLRDAATVLGAKADGTGKNVSPSEASAARQSGLARWQATRVVAHIEANLGGKLDVSELAELLSFSKSHFSRAFKRSLGETPMAYVALRRVERAKFIMTSTPEQLTDIAHTCGFADQSHLIRSFRRRVGMSPGVWRRMQAGPYRRAGRTESLRKSNRDICGVSGNNPRQEICDR